MPARAAREPAASSHLEAAPAARRPVAIIVSRFPLITETFILRELIELERQGQPVLLVPLLEERPDVVHAEARAWVARALYTPFLSREIIAANVEMVRRRPWRYAALLLRLLVKSASSANVWLRTAALFPKSVYLAVRLEQEGVAHVHAHFATHPATAAHIISSLTGLSYSLTVHGHDIFVAWRRPMLADKLRAATFVRAISEYSRAFLHTRYAAACDGKVRVIHVGVDPARYAAAAESAPSRQPPRLLAVAALKPYKGLPVLIDTCARLRAEGVEFTCDVVGDGPLRVDLQSRVRASGLGDRIRLHGPLPQDRVADLMAEASVVVLPSVIAPDGQMEGIPVSLMEAMAAGRPVVASRLSGVPELVEDDANGLLVEPGDAVGLTAAIHQLLADPARACALGRAGRETVDRGFRLDRVVADLLEQIDRYNPPHPIVDRQVRAVLARAGLSGRRLGVRRLRDRTDSRIVQILACGDDGVHELVLKIQKPRVGGSAPEMRARREFQVLTQLTKSLDARDTGARVPQPLHLDEEAAAIVMTTCEGVSLETCIRRTRSAGTPAAQRRLLEAMRSAAGWLQAFQREMPALGRADESLDALLQRALEHLEGVAEALGAGASKRIRATLYALRSIVDAAELRVVGCHGDLWPGNIWLSDRGVQVIDFEGFRSGLALEDAAYLLVQTDLYFARPWHRRLGDEVAAAFVAGFGQPRPDAAWRLCRLAAALQVLGRNAGGADARAWWRRRTLRRIVWEAST